MNKSEATSKNSCRTEINQIHVLVKTYLDCVKINTVVNENKYTGHLN